MKRLTTDTPKDNLEAALNLFYIKDHETWVRGYGPAPEYADVSLFDLTRDIVKTHIPDGELPADNDNLSNMMPEWLMDGIDSAEGIVALLYTAAWAYAELRHKLMRYEDTGLEPEEIADEVTAAKLMARSKIVSCFGVDADHVRELVKAEQAGQLVVLPCKVGDKVRVDARTWGNTWNYKTVDGGKYLLGETVAIIKTRKQTFIKIRVEHNVSWKRPMRRYPISAIGKTIFLTREEEEAALALKGGEG